MLFGCRDRQLATLTYLNQFDSHWVPFATSLVPK